nr:DUF3880 domain-containing protein [Butyrivibrio sp.]
MHIIYYDWNEFNGEDCRDVMKRLGHQVDVLKCGQERYKASPDVESRFAKLVEDAERAGNPYYLLFSFNYFPFLSDLCQEKDIPYVAWVFDSPHYPLYAININNPVNHVYVFDKKLQKELKESGARTIHYSPLAVNSDRLRALCRSLDDETDGRIVYEHDVSFVGSLYDNEFNFYDQIDTIPAELRSYFDELINSQVKLLGHDVFS